MSLAHHEVLCDEQPRGTHTAAFPRPQLPWLGSLQAAGPPEGSTQQGQRDAMPESQTRVFNGREKRQAISPAPCDVAHFAASVSMGPSPKSAACDTTMRSEWTRIESAWLRLIVAMLLDGDTRAREHA